MAWTTPRTWTTNELVTKSIMDTHVRDNLTAILPAGPSWTDVAYASGNFTADTGSWTVASGDQESYGYVEIGKTMHVRVRISLSTVASSPTNLRVAVPNGRAIAGDTHCGTVFAINNGTFTSGAFWQALAGNTYIQIYRDISATAWTGTDNVYVWGVFTFEIA